MGRLLQSKHSAAAGSWTRSVCKADYSWEMASPTSQQLFYVITADARGSPKTHIIDINKQFSSKWYKVQTLVNAFKFNVKANHRLNKAQVDNTTRPFEKYHLQTFQIQHSHVKRNEHPLFSVATKYRRFDVWQWFLPERSSISWKCAGNRTKLINVCDLMTGRCKRGAGPPHRLRSRPLLCDGETISQNNLHVSLCNLLTASRISRLL